MISLSLYLLNDFVRRLLLLHPGPRHPFLRWKCKTCHYVLASSVNAAHFAMSAFFDVNLSVPIWPVTQSNGRGRVSQITTQVRARFTLKWAVALFLPSPWKQFVVNPLSLLAFQSRGCKVNAKFSATVHVIIFMVKTTVCWYYTIETETLDLFFLASSSSTFSPCENCSAVNLKNIT